MSEKYETIVPSEPDAGERLQWVSWLRSAAPYVHLHHGRTFVISFAGEVVADRTLLNHLVMDVSLIASMGMRVVLVHGSRPQIEELMGLRKLEGQFYKGVRITGPQELECVKEACGETRFDIEAAFSQGLPNTPMQHSRIKGKPSISPRKTLQRRSPLPYTPTNSFCRSVSTVCAFEVKNNRTSRPNKRRP